MFIKNARHMLDLEPVGQELFRPFEDAGVRAELVAPPGAHRIPIEALRLGNGVVLKLLNEDRESFRPRLEIDMVEPADTDIDLVVGEVVGLDRNDKIPQLVPLLGTDRAIELIERAAFLIRCSRQNVNELHRPGADSVLDVFPELFAAEEFCQVAPDRITLVGQLDGKPKRQLVFFGVRMANENHVPLGRIDHSKASCCLCVRL